MPDSGFVKFPHIALIVKESEHDLVLTGIMEDTTVIDHAHLTSYSELAKFVARQIIPKHVSFACSFPGAEII